MKRILKIAVLSAVCAVMLCACGQSELARQAEIQGRLSLAAGDYETARNTLKLSIDEGNPTDEALEAYSVIDGYLKARAALEDADYETARGILEQIPEAYKELAAADDIDRLKAEIAAGAADADSASARITSAAKLLITQQYNEAYALLNSIDMRFITDEEADKVMRLKEAAGSAVERMLKAQEIGEAQAEADAARTERTIDNEQ